MWIRELLRCGALLLLASGSCHGTPRDPWAYELKRVRQPPAACPKAALIPSCPANTSRGQPVAEALLALDGQHVTVSGQPVVAAMGTMLGCPNSCCNAVSGDILLCGGSPKPLANCSVSVVIGGCSGDDCQLCCTHNVENRLLVASGKLERTPGRLPGGFELEGGDSGVTSFQLTAAELCYLE